MSKGEAIHDALENEYGARIVIGDKWLAIEDGTYTVYQRKYGERKTRTLVVTGNEVEAVAFLTN